jgi:hypothetical protein
MPSMQEWLVHGGTHTSCPMCVQVINWLRYGVTPVFVVEGLADSAKEELLRRRYCGLQLHAHPLMLNEESMQVMSSPSTFTSMLVAPGMSRRTARSHRPAGSRVPMSTQAPLPDTAMMPGSWWKPW